MAHAARVHSEDTGWRLAGRPAQLMAFTTETATVCQIHGRHCNEEVREVIPADYAAVLCTDRGKSYDPTALTNVKQQKCLAYLQRSISEPIETKWGRRRGLRRLFAEALALRHAERNGAAGDFATEATQLQARLTDLLRQRSMRDPDNQRLLNQLRRHHQRGNLLRLRDDPRIEPTNNRAKRALRPAAIVREASQCSKNQRGAEAFAAFVGVTRTFVQRGRSASRWVGSRLPERSGPSRKPPSKCRCRWDSRLARGHVNLVFAPRLHQPRLPHFAEQSL